MEWANRGEQIRKMVDLLYARYREAARRSRLTALQSPGKAPPQPDGTSLDARLSRTRWTFPINQKPKEERWIEFAENGKLVAGWTDEAKSVSGAEGHGSRSWKAISPTRVEFEPFTSHDWIFVVDFDPGLAKGRIVEGEFKGQTIERAE
jgi:hypothetical protein